jgi:hypothetical protein
MTSEKEAGKPTAQPWAFSCSFPVIFGIAGTVVRVLNVAKILPVPGV